MTRKSSSLVLVLTVFGALSVAVPASAAGGYESINAITGPPSTHEGGYESINAITGPVSARGSGDLSSAPDARHYSSVSAITGPAPAEPALVSTDSNEGFDWLDALIGGLIASALMGMTLLAARTVGRHRQPAGSRT